MSTFPIKKQVVKGQPPVIPGTTRNNLPKEDIPIYAPPFQVDPLNPPV